MTETGPKNKRAGNAFLETVLPALAIVAFVRVFLVGLYRVPTASMEGTIRVGDCVLGERISYRFTHPRLGEIVTFECPDDPGVTLVKRVIATEGQVVDIRDGSVYVDGLELNEPYAQGRTLPPNQDNDAVGITYPHVVTQGRVWVMGDNRARSRDSRWFGDLPATSIATRIVCTYWPFERFGMVT